MITATERAYRSNFTGRFMPSETRKSYEIKTFHGVQSTSLAQAHCIKDNLLSDETCGSGGFIAWAKKRGDME